MAVIKKRMLLWDYTNTQNTPNSINNVNFNGPLSSVANWNTWVPPELQNRAPFRPQIHLLPQLEGNEWNNVLNSGAQIVLYFNEPERAGITPQQAADIWHNQVVPQLRNGKGMKLCSPSCSNDSNGQQWITQFMGLVQDAPPDFLGLHYYGTDCAAAYQFIQNMHSQFPNQPIMVTEVASIARDYPSVLSFTAELANWMDGTDYIAEYAFFGCMEHLADDFVSPAAQLMNADGSFTDLMKKLMNDQPIAPS